MLGYEEVQDQDALTSLVQRVAGFHDSLIKEIHLINRASVDMNGSMDMAFRYDVQVLFQSQWKPRAFELLFVGVRELRLGSAGEHVSGYGVVETESATASDPVFRVCIDGGAEIAASRVYFRERESWVGAPAFLGFEVPMPEAVTATPIIDDWRQCGACADGWQARADVEYTRCPSCHALTRLSPADVEARGD